MKEYTTIPQTEQIIEVVVEKSRFITCAVQVGSVEQAIDFVTRKKKQYYDATHNVYAYVVGGVCKFSDDGEPQGTAGLPVYECIRNNNLDNVCVVVTRYFGGVKLGAGGLVRAYSGACNDCLKSCKYVYMKDCFNATVTVDYAQLKLVRNTLGSLAKEISVDFGSEVTLHYLLLASNVDAVANAVTECTLGKSSLMLLDNVLSEYDL